MSNEDLEFATVLTFGAEYKTIYDILSAAIDADHDAAETLKLDFPR